MKKSVLFFVVYSTLMACKRTDTATPFLTASDFYPLRVGKSWTYRMDSTGPFNFGSQLVTTAYLVKDTITADTFRDNSNRLSYTVIRLLNDSNGTQNWNYLLTYFATPTATGMELVDDRNLRFIKLTTPVSSGRNWLGNSYIDTKSAGSPWQYMDNWNYQYINVGRPDTIGNITYPQTVTILQRDETSPDLPFDPAFYQQRNLSKEIYAEGVGLVYQEFLHWTWQTTPPPAGYEDDSYGIRLQLIDYRP
jgi:hypothetical protein